VFNIIIIENVVNDKYNTKNNNTDAKEVFLAIRNHMRAIISSSRNFRVTLTRVKKAWLLFSLLCPARKITSVIIVVAKNEKISQNPSGNEMPKLTRLLRIPRAPVKSNEKNMRNAEYRQAFFN